MYAHGQLSQSEEAQDGGDVAGQRRPNPAGNVADVDEAGLEALKQSGPVLVDFFAPWCPQ